MWLKCGALAPLRCSLLPWLVCGMRERGPLFIGVKRGIIPWNIPSLTPQTASQRINCTDAAWNRLEAIGTSHLAKVGPKGRHPWRSCTLGACSPWLALCPILRGHLPFGPSPCSRGASAWLCKLDWASLLLALLWAKIGLVISLFFSLLLAHFRYISM
jgi:hypothetical protein